MNDFLNENQTNNEEEVIKGTLPEEPQKTVADEPQETITDEKNDIVMEEPQETIAEEPQETEGDDEAPEVDEKSEPVSKRGEMYELGNSILMCGDSTSAEDVARLMGGENADMVFTDPPYNMSDNLSGFVSDEMKTRLDKIVDFDPMTIKDILLNLGTKNIYIFTSKNLIPNYFDIFKHS